MKTIFSLFLSIFFLLPASLSAQEISNIRLQLKWWHQFQFAGYYAADIKGFYKNAALNVNLVPGDASHSPVTEVSSGRADYGVAGAEILLDYINGAPIQVLAAVFQHSPYVIISSQNSHISTPSDLLGKKVMVSDNQGWVQLKAILKKEGIDPAKLRTIPHTWNNNDILNGHADAMSGYSSVEVIQMEQKGIPINIINPKNYGVDFYGDVLFASKNTIKNKEEITNKFTAATLKGWEYAMAHPREIAEYIMTLPGVKERGVTVEGLLLEASNMQELVVPKLVEIGHINPGRWQHMLDIYKTLNLVSKDKELDGFIYEKESPSTHYLKIVSYIFIGVLFILLLLFFYSVNMKKAVRNRTKELEKEVRRRMENEESLKAITQELQSSNNELRQYAYITSHNLRAPVTNLLSLIKLFNTGDLSEKNALYFNKIAICTNNLNSMLKDLNVVLSVRTEKCQDKMLVDFERELKVIQESISEEIAATGTLITYDFSKAPDIMYERKNIHSIFQNLLTNAIKYRKPGAPAHIDITSEKNGEDIKLMFSDNGIGINMNRYGDRVFGIYQRFNEESEGKGLGLYIVKTQVEKYGGSIIVESIENLGTKFTITLKNHIQPDEKAA